MCVKICGVKAFSIMASLRVIRLNGPMQKGNPKPSYLVKCVKKYLGMTNRRVYFPAVFVVTWFRYGSNLACNAYCQNNGWAIPCLYQPLRKKSN